MAHSKKHFVPSINVSPLHIFTCLTVVLFYLPICSGYMAPEYAMEGLYSIKSDVFGFGVLLLEIITGKRNAGFYHSNKTPSLLSYVCEYVSASELTKCVV